MPVRKNCPLIKAASKLEPPGPTRQDKVNSSTRRRSQLLISQMFVTDGGSVPAAPVNSQFPPMLTYPRLLALAVLVPLFSMHAQPPAAGRGLSAASREAQALAETFR